MAGHVRVGARTGGSLVILGSIVIIIALFFSQSVAVIFKMFPPSILGVILFLAGAELAVTVRDIGNKRDEFYTMIVVAGFAMWHMGVAFVVGVILDNALRRKWIKI
jgi:MFS superfamily sulfate permease-like transporter